MKSVREGDKMKRKRGVRREINGNEGERGRNLL